MDIRLPISEVFLVASGDLRLAANQQCWPAQAEMERLLSAAFETRNVKVKRAHPLDEQEGHGFISSQRMGMDVFKTLPKDVPIVVAEAVWQYSHHVLAGLLLGTDVGTYSSKGVLTEPDGTVLKTQVSSTLWISLSRAELSRTPTASGGMMSSLSAASKRTSTTFFGARLLTRGLPDYKLGWQYRLK